MDAINQFLPKFKGKLIPLTIMLSFGIILYACSETQNPLNVDSSNSNLLLQKSSVTQGASTFGVETEVTISGFTIEFKEMEPGEIDGNPTSTFKYTVTRTENASGFNYLFFETPSCAIENLKNYTPGKGEETVIDGTDGIKWTASMGKGESRDYSITYSGNQPTGMIDVTIQGSGSGSDVTKQIAGPCKGVYEISGSIFIDSNGDGVKQTSESGIGGVNVTLSMNDTAEEIGQVLTAEDGTYSFLVLPGNFSISVPDNLFNESYNLFTTSPLPVNVDSSDVSGMNFGYTIDSGKFVKNIEDGEIQLNTEQTRYWVRQVRHAGKRNSEFSVDEMEDLLTTIEGFYLEQPFQFGTDKLNTALDILTRPLRTELDELLQQLLTAQLNVFSNRGAYSIKNNGEVVLNEGFNRAVLIYGEAIACAEMGTCPEPEEQGSLQSVTMTSSYTLSSTRLSDGTTVLSAFNGGGGSIGDQ